MKIISSNIRFENPEDGIHDWPKRKNLLTKILLKHQADLICTQEGRKDQLYDFEKLIKFNMVRSHRKWLEDRMYPTIFTGNNINVHASGDIWLSSTPEVAGSKFESSLFPRLCTWAKIIRNKNECMVVNVHLDHQNEDTRLLQIKVLIKEVLKIKNKLPLFLCGDFNSSPNNSVMKEILNSELDLYDPWVKMNKSEMASHHKFDGDIHSGNRIDWILCSKNIETKEMMIDTTNESNQWPSDHFPVVAEFIF